MGNVQLILASEDMKNSRMECFNSAEGAYIFHKSLTVFNLCKKADQRFVLTSSFASVV